MTQSTLLKNRFAEPLRSLALTVEEAEPGAFRWRILEKEATGLLRGSVCASEPTFTAYDTALAHGYGELQRLIGPDLQYGPRLESAHRHASVVEPDHRSPPPRARSGSIDEMAQVSSSTHEKFEGVERQLDHRAMSVLARRRIGSSQ